MHHSRLVMKVRGAVDERQCLDDAVDPVEIAEMVADTAQQLNAGRAGREVRVLRADLRTYLAPIEQIAVVVGRPVTGDEEQIAVLHNGHQPAALLDLAGQLDPEIAEFGLYGSHVSISLC